MRNFKTILIILMLIFGLNEKSDSGTLPNYHLESSVDNYRLLKIKSVDKLKTRKINVIKNKLKKYINDVDTVYYFKHLNDDHLLKMDSLMLVYRIPDDIFYRQKIKESWFISDIESSAGAIGYSQIMYNTYLFFKDTLKLKDPTRLDVDENLLVGAYYMRYLKDQIDNLYEGENLTEKTKWEYVLSSYNAGLSVHRHALVNYKETKNYVKYIMKYRET